MPDATWKELFGVSIALIEKSGLAKFNDGCFKAETCEAKFEKYWESRFHKEYGRYMVWILFEVGAENLAKAACVRAGIVKVSSKPRLHHYTQTYFKKLPDKASVNAKDLIALTEGYKELGRVRNRDAHSFRKGERQADFPLVEKQLVPAFNILVKTLFR